MSHSEREVIRRLEDFFTREVTADGYALTIRRLLYETIGMSLSIEEEQWALDKGAIQDGHYWLNELCEILDPQLTRD